jgi:hypothetical protein
MLRPVCSSLWVCSLLLVSAVAQEDPRTKALRQLMVDRDAGEEGRMQAQEELLRIMRAERIDNAERIQAGDVRVLQRLQAPTDLRAQIVLRAAAGKPRFLLTYRRDNQLPHEMVLDDAARQLLIQTYEQEFERIARALVVCRLTPAQRTKLEQVAAGEAARLFHRARDIFSGSRQEQEERGLNPIEECNRFNEFLQTGLLNESTLFSKVLQSTVTEEQQNYLVNSRIRALLDEFDNYTKLPLDAQARAFGLPYPTPGQTETSVLERLTPEQREQLAELLSVNFESENIMLRLLHPSVGPWAVGRIAEADLLAILSPVQARAFLALGRLR